MRDLRPGGANLFVRGVEFPPDGVEGDVGGLIGVGPAAERTLVRIGGELELTVLPDRGLRLGHPFAVIIGDLVVTGPTGTNVGDVGIG